MSERETVLVLKTVNANGTNSYDRSFTYPEVGGVVEAPLWKATEECDRYGLYGIPRGVGRTDLYSTNGYALWLVIEVDKAAGYVEFEGKCKFARGTVVYRGARDGAIAMLNKTYSDAPLPWVIRTAGDWGTAIAGYRGTAIAGYRGTAIAGDGGTATAGARGTATAGEEGTATAGEEGTAIAGYRGTATAGYRGTATAGARGTATAGDWGTATAGDGGTATAGDGGTATAGDGGILCWKVWDGERYRLHVRYVGEDGIKADTPYRCVNGEVKEVV